MCFNRVCYLSLITEDMLDLCDKGGFLWNEKISKTTKYLLRHKAIQFNNNNFYTLNSSSNFT